jgi:hypothetical protein
MLKPRAMSVDSLELRLTRRLQGEIAKKMLQQQEGKCGNVQAHGKSSRRKVRIAGVAAGGGCRAA